MLARFALRNEKIIAFVVVVLALLGVRAYLGTTAGIFPAMTFARVDVVADAGDLPPDRVRIAITQPLERALQAVPAVTNVVATSSQGSAEAVVSFSSATDAAVALESVDRALAQIRSEIPSAKSLTANAVSPNREPIVSFALTSREVSQTVLREIALAQIVPHLYGTPGLGRVLVNGGATREYRVALDPARLGALGIGAADVVRAISDASDVRGVGSVQRGYRKYAILVDSALHDRTSLGDVRVALKSGESLPLASIATIDLGVSPVANQTSFDGENAVVISAYIASGGDSVAMATAFRSRMDALVPSLPRNVNVAPFWDQSTLIVASQTALRDAILLGALLAIAVIYAFLRDARLTLVAAAVIPLAMAIALLALQLAGQTLNLMSVGGLAVAVGLIIDDAIVVIEGIARNRRGRPEAGTDAAIERTMGELARPMIASTATTVVVFLPLALLGGVTGFFFRALAFTLSAALLVSLALALFVTPIIARTFLRETKEKERSRDPIDALLGRYDASLGWALDHRAIVAAASLGILGLTAALLATLPSDFLPKLDEGQFEIAYTLPVGTSLAASDEAALAMERVVRTDPDVASVAGLTGLDSNGVSPTQPNSGALRVRLRPSGSRAGYEAIAARLRDRLAATVPSGVFDFRQILEDLIFDLSGDTAPIELTIHGDEQRTLAATARRVARGIASVHGVVDAASGVTYDSPTIRIAPRAVELAALGLSGTDVSDALAAREQGTVASSLPGAQALVPVRVTIAGTSSDAGALLDPSAPLNVTGGATSLGTVAAATTQRLASDIVTQNGALIDRVTAGSEGASLSAVTAGIRKALAKIALPAGYSIEIGGQAQSQARSFSEFANVIGLAVVLVFAVMLATFRSFRIPLVILTAVPLALIGVALGLFLTHTAFNVSSFMGLLLLVGVVVKNGILFIDVTNRRRAEGARVREALMEAGNTRLRPIVMTTLAAIGGLLPLAFGIGQGAEMEKPLAIAVIGGLSTATLFTLVVIPVIYAAFVGREKMRVDRRVAISVTAIVALVLLGVRPSFVSAQPTGAVSSQKAQAPQASLAFAGLSLDTASQSSLVLAPDVLASKANLAESRAMLALARSTVAPSVVVNYAQVPQGNPPGPNVVSRQVASVVQFAISDFVARSPAVREAAFAFAAADADERAAELAERVRVTGLYYDALKAREVVRAGRDALALARAEHHAATVRFCAGDVARLDVTRSDVEVAKAEAALELATASDENATGALQTETGAPSGALADTSSVGIVAPSEGLDDPQIAIASARANRPEIASARALADASIAAIASARASAFPALTVGAGYVTGTDSGVPIDAPTVVANFTLPLGAGAHGRVAVADARALAARAKAVGVERTILAEVADAARTLRATEAAAAATSRERDAAELALRATEIGYRNGASSSLEVGAARAAYAAAVVDAIDGRYDVEKARATLLIEIGK